MTYDERNRPQRSHLQLRRVPVSRPSAAHSNSLIRIVPASGPWRTLRSDNHDAVLMCGAIDVLNGYLTQHT